MDPEANMKEQLELATEITELIDEAGDAGSSAAELSEIAELAGRLAELVTALHEWNRNQRPVSAGL